MVPVILIGYFFFCKQFICELIARTCSLGHPKGKLRTHFIMNVLYNNKRGAKMSDKKRSLPDFPYGAVYFRYSNPPEEDWEQDYQTASEDGNNIFRHWFLWSAIEVAPGEFDWSKYDRQLELGAKYNIKAIISEMTKVVPDWALRKYPHARYISKDGSSSASYMHGSCVTGGVKLCLDNEDVKKHAGRFIKKLAERYKGHPGLAGYDIWNECNIGQNVCYCEATQNKFRQWLQDKYSDLDELRQAWYRPGLSSWEDIQAPRHNGSYPDVMDWLQFRIDNAYSLMRWRINIIKDVDPSARITAHGIARSLRYMAPRAVHDWRAADEVEIYGYTWGSSRNGDEPWKQWHAVDLVRSSSQGKPFWHAEAYGGPLWMAGNVIDKPRYEGRIARPEDIRLWDMQSFAAGATGLLFLRWRPLLDGPLFGAFGPYGLDGSRTDRSRMSSKIAKWANDKEQSDLWKSRPIKGEIGILFIPESQIHCYAQQGDTKFYSDAMEGSYQGFFDNNIQADWVYIDHIEEYDLLYLPYPVMLKQETADRLKEWVNKGGLLITEGCPAYFGNRGKVGTSQPNLGLNELFGAEEDYVEFTPDLLKDLTFNFKGNIVYGGTYLQTYKPTTGEPVGWYKDGRIAAVENEYGQGRTILIGTFPGCGYFNHPGSSRDFFAGLLDWAGKKQAVVVNDQRFIARIHEGQGGVYLWIINTSEEKLTALLSLAEKWQDVSNLEVLWGIDKKPVHYDNKVRIDVNRRDAAVIKLKSGQ